MMKKSFVVFVVAKEKLANFCGTPRFSWHTDTSAPSFLSEVGNYTFLIIVIILNCFSNKAIIDGFRAANAMICSLWKTIERKDSFKKNVVTNFTQKNWRGSASIPQRSLSSPRKVGQLFFCNYKNYKVFFQKLMDFVLLMLWCAFCDKIILVCRRCSNM